MLEFVIHCLATVARFVYVGWIFRHKGAPLYITALLLTGCESWLLGELAVYDTGALLEPLVPRIISCTWLSVWFRFVWGIGLVCTSLILFYSEIHAIMSHQQLMSTAKKQKLTLAITGSMYLAAMTSACVQPACARVPLGVRVWLACTCVMLWMLWAIRARACAQTYGRKRRHVLLSTGAMALAGLLSIATSFGPTALSAAVARWIAAELATCVVLVFTVGGGFGPGFRMPAAAPHTFELASSALDSLRNNKLLAHHFLSFVNRAHDFMLDDHTQSGTTTDGGLILTRHDIRRWVREVIDGVAPGAFTVPPGILVVLYQIPGDPQWQQKAGQQMLLDAIDSVYYTFVTTSIHFTTYSAQVARYTAQRANLRSRGYDGDEIVLLDAADFVGP